MSWIFSGKCSSTNRLDGKTAVITGANTGIGKETALEFYKRGARVIMACRDLEKTQSAVDDIQQKTEDFPSTGEIVIKQLDLSSFDSIRKCAADILESESQIHLLINNAGVMGLPRLLSKDGYEMHFAVNHLGHFLFTLLLLPKIIHSAPARIVILSSIAHSYGDGLMHYEDINIENMPYNHFSVYGRSKLANILFAKELARRLEGTGVTTYAIHPGLVNTELSRNFDNIMPLGSFVFSVFGKPFLKSPVQGVQTTLYCSLDDKCANESGLYYSDCKVTRPYPRAEDMDAARELWEKSIQMVKLDNYDPFTAG